MIKKGKKIKGIKMKNKKIKNIVLLLTIGMYSLSINAADVGQGKWYRFTSDFINNCVKSVNETKNSSSESKGKTVSGVNPPVDLADCLSSSPYLDSESQLDPTSLGISCASGDDDGFLLPTGSTGQTVEIVSKDNLTKSTFECSGSTWSIKSSQTVSYQKNDCSERGVNWVNEANEPIIYNLTSALSNESVERSEYCFANLPVTSSGNSVILKSITNMGEGKIKFKCNNGSWIKESEVNYVSSCKINYCQNNTTVSWFDSRITNYSGIPVSSNNAGGSESHYQSESFNADIGSSSMNDDINELKSRLSSASISKKEISEIVNKILGEIELQSSGRDIGGGTIVPDPKEGSAGGAFDLDPNLKNKPVCIAKVKTFDSGKTGTADFYQNDKRLFLSEEAALKESNILEGKGYFNCHNGKWEIDLTKNSVCERKTNYSCERIEVTKIRGQYKYMYKCGIR
jgi:hypothetical protein